MNVKHVSGGTMVGGAIFSVRRKWRPWQIRTFVLAKHEYKWQQVFITPLTYGDVDMDAAIVAVFRELSR